MPRLRPLALLVASLACGSRYEEPRVPAGTTDDTVASFLQSQHHLHKFHGQVLSARRPAHLVNLDLQPASGPNACERIAFVRIQKTGGSSFQKIIMPAMMDKYNQTSATFGHIEFKEASHAAPSCMVTILRDPVHRFMSEFGMARSTSNQAMFQAQWDFHEQDLSWLSQAQTMLPQEDAMMEYLQSPKNPSRNRQALYLLGFVRVRCRMQLIDKSALDGDKCALVEPYGYPAREYDWDKDHDELLARAKQRLSELRSFAITDCFVDSMRLLATAVGWDPEETAQLAEIRDEDRSAASNMTASLWEQGLSPEQELRIREVNRIDMELLAYAKQLMYDKHGVHCVLNQS